MIANPVLPKDFGPLLKKHDSTQPRRPCHDLPGYWADAQGHIWTDSFYGQKCPPRPLNPVYVSYGWKVPVTLPGGRRKLATLAQLVMGAWVGPPEGRSVFRIPPLDWWEHPFAPENLHYDRWFPTDDLSAYLETEGGRFNFTRPITDPRRTYTYVDVPLSGGVVKRLLKSPGQIVLRDEYEKVSHPDLTELQVPPMLPVPKQE